MCVFVGVCGCVFGCVCGVWACVVVWCDGGVVCLCVVVCGCWCVCVWLVGLLLCVLLCEWCVLVRVGVCGFCVAAYGVCVFVCVRE